VQVTLTDPNTKVGDVTPTETPKDATTTETQAKVTDEQAVEGEDKREFRKKKPKKGEVVVEKEESIVTENSISYAEYKEKHSQKNQNLNQQKKQVVVESAKLDPTLKEYDQVDDSIGLGKKAQKPTTQPKEKVNPQQLKTDQKEKELNYNVGKKKKFKTKFQDLN
jgi:hypothetical protein